MALESNSSFLNFGASDNTGLTHSWKNSNIVKTLFGLFIFSFHMVPQIISHRIFLYGTKVFKQPVLTEWRFERSKYSDAFILRALNFFVKPENYYFFSPRVVLQPKRGQSTGRAGLRRTTSNSSSSSRPCSVLLHENLRSLPGRLVPSYGPLRRRACARDWCWVWVTVCYFSYLILFWWNFLF